MALLTQLSCKHSKDLVTQLICVTKSFTYLYYLKDQVQEWLRGRKYCKVTV
jgi:hypothetical protein